MVAEPLSAPRRDPTANHALNRVTPPPPPLPTMCAAGSVRYPSADAALTQRAPQSIEECRQRRDVLIAAVESLDREARVTDEWEERRQLIAQRSVYRQAANRLIQWERSEIATHRLAIPPAPIPERVTAAREVFALTEGETIYRLFRMFHYYSRHDEGMPDAHKRFLVGVREILKGAGYTTRDPASGDPLT